MGGRAVDRFGPCTVLQGPHDFGKRDVIVAGAPHRALVDPFLWPPHREPTISSPESIRSPWLHLNPTTSACSRRRDHLDYLRGRFQKFTRNPVVLYGGMSAGATLSVAVTFVVK
jgi:hypothetical protein